MSSYRSLYVFILWSVCAAVIFIRLTSDNLLTLRATLSSRTLINMPVDTPSNRAKLLKRRCGLPLLNLVAELTANRRSFSNRVLVDYQRNLSYCNVPKTGSSFWFGAFHILNGNGSRSPYDIREIFGERLHSKVKVTFLKQLPAERRNYWLQSSKLFLIVRDPYSRLFSAYVNKLVLPNAFYWRTTGKIIIHTTRRFSFEVSRKCGHDVTFEEFLRHFVATETGESRYGSDHHWTPIYKLCSPCHHDYSLIGKTETLFEDTAAILKATRLQDKIDFDGSAEKFVKVDIISTIKLFLENILKVGNCSDIQKDMWRLWYSFSAKGYFKHDMEIPKISKALFSRNITAFAEGLYQKAWALYQKQSFLGSRAKYRKKIMTEAFRSVPQDTLLRVRNILLPDFLLFGYNSKPHYIFPDKSIFVWNSNKIYIPRE